MTSENYDSLPLKIKKIIDDFYGGEQYTSFKNLKKLSKKLESLGYSLDYDMSGDITEIKKNKINKRMKNKIGLGALKPRLKRGDVLEVYGYVSKRDVYGNPYNSGQVFLNNKLIGEWGKNWGGESMARQNGRELIKSEIAPPRGTKWSNFPYMYQLKSKNITFREYIKEDIPIRQYNKFYS